MGQFSAPNVNPDRDLSADEQNDWSPNDEIDPDLQEPENAGETDQFTRNYNEEYPY